MSRTLSTKSQGEVTKQTTRPLWLVEIGFSTVLRLSSRESLTIGANTYAAAGVRVNLQAGSVEIFNESFQYTTDFKSGPGKSVKVWKAYGAGPFTASDIDMVFHGEVGAVPKIGEVIQFSLRPASSVFTPRLMVAPLVFNHLPPDGAEIITPTGIYILTRDA